VISKHPCDGALTSTQLTQLFGEVPTARHTDDATGAACQWQKGSTAATIDVGYMTGVTGGLSQVYERQQSDAYHQTLEIGGFPALAYNVTENPPVGGCDIAVGITDSLAVNIGFGIGSDRYGKQNPCDAANIIAQDVMENLKAAQ
jgi:hypothetical protein